MLFLESCSELFRNILQNSQRAIEEEKETKTTVINKRQIACITAGLSFTRRSNKKILVFLLISYSLFKKVDFK